MARWVWGRSASAAYALDAAEKAKITAACEKVIADALIPRFLPKITPSDFNYPISISGRWHGKSYRFVTRYRSGFPENLGEEFDSPFARIEFVGPDRFDLGWFRHTGKWHTLERSITLARALGEISRGEVLAPC
jgi:hypothetical protein